MGKKVLIVGGVAGGGSAAARLRRLDDSADIILFERGEYVSYANCGLPYYISGMVEDSKELMTTPAGTVRDSAFFKKVKKILFRSILSFQI